MTDLGIRYTNLGDQIPFQQECWRARTTTLSGLPLPSFQLQITVTTATTTITT
eukprot:m.23282 g.23282  ORF g.23282 m.23282 type:complete len:53 (+) comp7483_c0_seq2:1180-1338(+)